MKFLITIILIAVCSAVAEYFLPWWTIAIVAFMVAIAMPLKPGKAFLSGFVGIALFWLCAALMKDIPNEHILSSRMAVLFFKKPNYDLFILVTVLVGGLVGGMAAWSGALIRSK
jgi:hypothetical protein